MKNILYTIILSFLFSFSVFADWESTKDAYNTGDYETALREIKPLAEQGYAAAQFIIARMYEKGEGVTQDYKEALKWYRLAAEQGYAAAQSNLGVLYASGEGVIQDVVIADMWFNIAASNGYEDAKTNRDIAESNMTSEQITKAQELARECQRKNFIDCG